MTPKFPYKGVTYDFYEEELVKAMAMLSIRTGEVHTPDLLIEKAIQSRCTGETVGMVVASWASSWDGYLHIVNK